MNPSDNIPIEHLWHLYSFNPLTGQLYSNTKHHYITGKKQKYSRKVHIHWRGHIYATSYSRVIFAWIYKIWPINVYHKDGNHKNTRLTNLRARTRFARARPA